MSESSFGGSQSSTGSSVQHVAKPGEDEVFESAGASIQTGIFGVLYTVSKERTPSAIFVTLKLFMEWLQLFLLMVNPWYGYTGLIDYGNSGWYVISFVHLRHFMITRGYTFYIGCLYLFTFALLVICGLCAYVYTAFINNHFDLTWPIKIVRWYVVIFLQIFDIASMMLLLISVDCSYWNPTVSNVGFNAEFPDHACWVMPHIIHAAVAILAFVTFVVLALLFSMAEMDLNLVTRNYYALGNSSIEVVGFCIKTVLVGNCIFLTDMRWKAAMQFIFSLWLAWIYIKWLPHTYTAVNLFRCASYSSICFTTLPLLVLSFQANVIYSNPSDLVDFNKRVTAAMWACLVPAALIGAGLCYWRHRYFAVSVIERFRTAPAGTKTKLIFKFSHPRQAEILVRCCRQWTVGWNNSVDHDALEPDAIKTAETIIKAGIAQLSSHSYMIILWSSYLIDVMQSFQSGYSQLQGAKKANPSFLERFAIFSREQDHTQKQSEQNNSDNTVDVVSFVEFQRNYKMALKVHKDALLSMRFIWKLLMHHKVSFQELAQAIKKMNIAVRIAEKVYRQVLNRHMNSPKLLKLYSHFLFEIKNDPWAAAKWLADSEVLNHEADKNKDNEFSTFQYAIDRAMGADKTDMELCMHDKQAVIIMNGNATIQMAQGCEEMFGYGKSKELQGKNVNVLMPPPICEQHTAVVRSHITSGKRNVIDKSSKLIAVRKDKYAFQMHLQVTHLSGVGEDSLYMGVIKPIARQKDMATAWILPNGQISGVDMSFHDWFGYKATDVVGTSIRKIMADAVVLETVMEKVEQLKLEGTTHSVGGSVTVEVDHGRLEEVPFLVDDAGIVSITDRVMLHRYHDPLHVDLTLELFGVGCFHLYAVSFRRRVPEQMLLVTDRQGRIRHITASLASMLGSHVEALKADNRTNALDAILPEPVCQIHHSLSQEAAQPRPAHLAPPMYSCFSGVSVCLKSVVSSSVELPRMLPCKLRIRYRELAPSDVCQVVTVDPVTLQAALEERCLKLTADSDGVIQTAGNSPPSLFGFHPQLLLGLNLADAIDVFKQGAKEAAQDTVFAGRLMGQPLVKAMLLKLAERSVASPGVSWRVGVLDPAPLPPCLTSLESVAKAHEAERTKPASLTVKVTTTNRAVAKATQKLEVTDYEESDEVVFEIELWRAELISSVLELDALGSVVNGGQANPLCPAELLLGAALEDKHISAVIPQMKELTVNDLFNGALTAGGQASVKRRSSIGGGLRGAEPVRSNGPVMPLSLRHQGDGGRIVVTAQAVWKSGSQSNAFLVMHAVKPSCGREDFARWLLAPGLAKSLSSSNRTPADAGGSPAARLQKKRSFMSPEMTTLPSILSIRRSDGGLLTDSSRKLQSANGVRKGTDPGVGPRSPSRASRAALEVDDDGVAESLHAVHADLLASSADHGSAKLERAGSGGVSVKKNFSIHTRAGNHNAADDNNSDDADAATLSVRAETSQVSKARLDQWLSAPTEAVNEHHADEFGGDSSVSVDHDATQHEQVLEDIYVDEAANTFTDYKRGKRFKNLLKALSNAQTTALLRRFKFHTILTVCLLFLAHLACFATMVALLTAVQDDVTDLQNSAFANRKVYEQAINIHSINLILLNKTSPTQPGFSGPEDLPPFVDDLDYVSSMFKTLHQGVYLGFRTFKRLPTKFGIRDIWDTPSIQVTTFYESAPNMTTNTTMMGLWDLGNLYLEKSRNIWALSSTAINATDPNNIKVNISKVSIADSADYHFVMVNGPNAINHYYQLTLDGLMQVTVEHSNQVNLIHIVIIAAEGLVLTFLAACWVWRITQEVTYLRYDMFNCFTHIPVATLRSLAEKPMQLDEDDEEEEDAIKAVEEAAAPEESKPAVRMKVSMADNEDKSPTASRDEAPVEQARATSFSWMKTLFGKSARVHSTSKRKLVKSKSSAIWMVAPFALWALMVILMNSINFMLLSPLGDSICLLNIVNFVLIRHHIMFFMALELLGTNAGAPGLTYGTALYLDPVYTASAAARFAYELQLFQLEYTAMLYSGVSIAEPDPHFSMSTTGIAISQNDARPLLYSSKDCLCEDPDNCLPNDDTSGFLDITHNGLDYLIKEYFQHYADLVLSDPSSTDFGAPQYSYIITLGQNDIEGGIVRLSQVYFVDVLANYKNTNTLQIIQLVFVSILTLVFIVFFVLPFITDVWVEVRRIAELLAQLPSEIDVDAIVARVVGGAVPPPTAINPKSAKSFKMQRAPRDASASHKGMNVTRSDW